MARLTFDSPLMWQLGLPLAGAVLVASAWFQWRRGVGRWHCAASTLLRGVVLVALVLLAARPVWVESAQEEGKRRAVVLLVDASESMSLTDGGSTRHEQALELARERLLPALKSADLPARAIVFAEEAREVDGRELARSLPDGKRTNLARAIAHAMVSTEKPPLAVIALTDGVATESADNARALAALAETRVPLVGIGFGSDTGAHTLSLRQVVAPPVAPTGQDFRISAELETTSDAALPQFDLVLLRNGQLAEKKTVAAGQGARVWLEGFSVSESEEGIHTYTVQLLPPAVAGLRCVNTVATAAVRIAGDRELRVLFAQGALTWDFKFISRALGNDPAIKLTGLSRTSSRSFFYQNIENTSELVNGFPAKIDDMAPFRVVVLSNLKPADLSLEQQELLARFCGEFGGGILLIGGADTFDASWQSSRLEQLLPVRFSPIAAGAPERPFRLAPTTEALERPAFQITDGGANRDAWARLPAFTLYARVDSAKPGAWVWARHPDDAGADGRRVLMACQRYGAGLSAVICVQNFWRWRLAKESDPKHFDRFWLQLFRFLSEGSQERIAIRFPDQELRPGSNVRVSVERRPSPGGAAGDAGYVTRVENSAKEVVLEQAVELTPGRAVDVEFRAEAAGVYTVAVLDSTRVAVATRPVEVKETNVEFERAARDMENLRQWANLSDGFAIKAEECVDAAALVAEVQTRAEQAQRRREPARLPAGINGWVLLALLALLSAEWLLRRQWGWV